MVGTEEADETVTVKWIYVASYTLTLVKELVPENLK